MIYGENESGKTTVYQFIRGMLFGIEKRGGRSAAGGLYETYEPWENAASYEGILRFESGGKIFRLERSFYRKDRRASLICETDGEELSPERGDLSALMDGVTKDTYENTIAIGQMKTETDAALWQALKNQAANYRDSGSEDVNVSGALEILAGQKKAFAAELRGLENERAAREARIKSKYDYLLEETRAAENERERITRALSDAERKKAKELSPETKTRPVSGRIGALAGFAACAVSVILFALRGNAGFALAALACAVFSAALLINGRTDGRSDIGQVDAVQTDAPGNGPVTGADEEAWQLKGQLSRMESDKRERLAALNNLEELLAETKEPSDAEKEARLKIRALEIAREKITEIAKELRNRYGREMNEKMSAVLREITADKYNSVIIDENDNLFLNTERKRIPAEEVSRGTRDQIYFALRMAALDTLYGEDLPVVCDDAFTNYDDARLTETLKWLAGQNRQILLFTCQKREERILRESEIAYSTVTL